MQVGIESWQNLIQLSMPTDTSGWQLLNGEVKREWWRGPLCFAAAARNSLSSASGASAGRSPGALYLLLLHIVYFDCSAIRRDSRKPISSH